jgi:hypothetical protein
MELPAGFSFQPIPPIEEPETFAAPAAGEGPAMAAAAPAADPLRLLPGLAGTWTGEGFNVIWRPNHTPESDHFLELNRTVEQLEFEEIPGTIPNRGLLQKDLPLHGLRYLQTISDANVLEHGQPKGQHLEPGLWVIVPPTSNPHEPQTVARLASIPHGTTILAQGTAHRSPGAPDIPDDSIKPFPNNLDHFPPHPDERIDFDEQKMPLERFSRFRTSGVDGPLRGVKKVMVNNPNSVLQEVIRGQNIQTTTRLQVTTDTKDIPPPGGIHFPGSGTRNIAFLTGTRGEGGPNAVTTRVTATFWLETLQGHTEPRQLQYSQLVLLDFNGQSWPHITVATLHKQS